MNCEKVRATLTALWDNELPEAPARRMREHLAGCSECGAAWEALNGLHQALRRDPLPLVPPDLAARIAMAGRRRFSATRRRTLPH